VGVDAGILWIVAGVFTLRSLVRAAPGAAWGLACLGAGLRWGSLGIGDVETATRLFGATVVTGGVTARAGMAAVLVGAVVDEARRGGLWGDTWVERGAALVAGATLAPLFLVEGPVQRPWVVGSWAVAAAAVVVTALGLHPVARRLPAWVPGLAVVAGIVVAEAGG
jgi:hypothetical protein